jgi:hypothetical protein
MVITHGFRARAQVPSVHDGYVLSKTLGVMTIVVWQFSFIGLSWRMICHFMKECDALGSDEQREKEGLWIVSFFLGRLSLLGIPHLWLFFLVLADGNGRCIFCAWPTPSTKSAEWGRCGQCSRSPWIDLVTSFQSYSYEDLSNMKPLEGIERVPHFFYIFSRHSGGHKLLPSFLFFFPSHPWLLLASRMGTSRAHPVDICLSTWNVRRGERSMRRPFPTFLVLRV